MFTNAYTIIKEGIVAIVPKFSKKQSDFPEIVGTGFFISDKGVVCTCRHVADAIPLLFRPEGYAGCPGRVLLITELSVGSQKGLGFIGIDIENIGNAGLIGDTSEYLGPNPPNLSFLLLAVRDTPKLDLADSSIKEGEILAFAGFPMGTDLLKAPGWLHQLSPTLQWGIASGLLPSSRSPLPHAFIMHANTQAGASGSPVFRTDGKVVGMVNAVIEETYSFGGHADKGDKGFAAYKVPTSLTSCVPLETIRAVLKEAEKGLAPFASRPTLEQHIESMQVKPFTRGTNIFDEWRKPES
jgi:hypothetical protein